MGNSVGTKVQKKQSTILPDVEESRAVEKAVLALESACVRVMEARLSSGKDDVDGMYWQRKFQTIATPVSLSLAECKGPRHFHYHYKHSAKDDSVLQPVLENPMQVLAQVCKDALERTACDLVGINNKKAEQLRDVFDRALRGFLAVYH